MLQDASVSPGLALITGATSGIGAEFARQLARRGHALILHGRRQELLEELAGQLRREHSIEVQVLCAELATDAGISAVEAAAADPRLRLLVNNAGYGDPGLFQQRSAEGMLAMIRVHNEAVVRITRAAVEPMLAAGQGGIINVSSVAAWLPGRGSAMYYATKAFLNAFSRSLAADLAGTGIGVQALCPGFTHTEFHSREKLAGFRGSSIPRWLWMEAGDVVRCSLRRLGRGRVIVIPGLHNRLFAWIGGHEWLYRAITRKR